jgi:hypothetical protein
MPMGTNSSDGSDAIHIASIKRSALDLFSHDFPVNYAAHQLYFPNYRPVNRLPLLVGRRTTLFSHAAARPRSPCCPRFSSPYRAAPSRPGRDLHRVESCGDRYYGPARVEDRRTHDWPPVADTVGVGGGSAWPSRVHSGRNSGPLATSTVPVTV